ncbi:MAG TPA: molybdopterin-dependent oxidoreductase, partial [Planctomycetota bacterium]
MDVKPSVCPLDCPDRCALDVTVDAGQVVKIDGSSRSELTDGYICAKVRGFGKRQYAPGRLLHPMKRTGPKGSGQYAQVDWDEALGLIADRFKALDPEAILPFHYDGSNGLLTSGAMDMRFWNRLGSSQLGKTFCAANAGAAWKAVFEDMAGADPLDVRQSDGIVIWGFNPSASGIHLIPLVREAKKAGAFLAVIDPLRTPMAREADLHLAPRPGTDVLVALAAIRAAHEENLVDRAFVERSTRHFEELLAACPTPEAAAEISGVPAASIRALPRGLARARRPFFRVGWGLERNRNGTDGVRAALALRVVLGRFGERGSGVTVSTTPGYKMDRTPAEAPHLRARPARTVNMSELGRALEEVKDPPIGAVYVYNCNPVATAPNQARVVRQLAREDLFVAVHEQVWTDTCDFADVVLPATTFLEHKELCRSYGGYALQWSEPAVAPQGEARANHQVFQALARAMGFDEPELRSDEDTIARTLVKDLDVLKRDRIVPLRRPIPFGDAFPSRGFAELAGPHGPPRYRPPVVDAHLPLVLITPASDKAITSQLFELAPEKSARLVLSTSDAAARGLKHGDSVRARNSFGEVHATLAVSDDLAPGVASMPKGLWRKSTLNGWTANALAPDHLDPIGGGACYNDARVEVE